MNEIEFNITCKMRVRWVPTFIAMLNYMEILGGIGASRIVAIKSDGDGDFRPTFRINRKRLKDIFRIAEPCSDKNGNRLYDAG